MTPRTIPAWTRASALCLISLLAATAAARAAFVWVEAESAKEKKVRANPWYESVRKDGLSGGDWVAGFAESAAEPSEATVEFSVPEKATYAFWLRLGAGGSGYAYQIDGGEVVGFDVKAIRKEDDANRRKQDYANRFMDERNLALDGVTDARYVAWVRVGDVDLAPGKHSLRLLLGGTSGEKRFGGVDVALFATEPFAPNGQFKPGEKNPNEISEDESKMYPFAPATDALDPAAKLDLRSLNEEVAGQHGFIKLAPDGMSFVRGDGQPIRFWGGTDYNQRDLDLETLKRHAEFLAKRGVNIVRWHGDLPVNADRKDPGPKKLTDIDEKELDEAFKLVAGMKDAGIYTVLSPYWGSHTKVLPGWDVPESGNGNLSALVFYVPEVQAAYKGWLKELYTRKNPYTGIPLKDDPAVAIIQFQNEDSMLFWTMQSVKGPAEMILRRQFADWLKNKYGAPDKARAAWKDYAYKDDRWEEGLPALFMAWEFTSAAMTEKGAQPGFRERRADQLQFFGETMRAFNAAIAKYLRDDLGCKQLVNPGNWKTVDPVLVEDVERWSYAAGEVIGKNHYFSALHTGRTRGWQILADHIYADQSATKEPRELPTNVRQVMGRAFIIPESLWVPPNRYSCEGPLIVATQQCLNGMDAFFWFANGVPEWAPANDRSSMPKWTYANPGQLGQFFAAALIWRNGMLREGKPALVERRSLENLWNGVAPLTSEAASYDPNRDAGNFAKEVKLDSPVDPLVFLVGPVLVEYGADPAKTEIADYKPFIDRDKQTVKSNTGEIEIDYGRGLYLVKAPMAQGVAGFLGAAGEIGLGDLKVSCKNDHASVVAVALDGKPLAASGKILVQIGTYERPKGWTVEKVNLAIDGAPLAANRIVNAGGNPWMIRKIEADIAIKNGTLTKATVLDANGMASGPAKIGAGPWQAMSLPPEAMYVLLER